MCDYLGARRLPLGASHVQIIETLDSKGDDGKGEDVKV